MTPRNPQPKAVSQQSPRLEVAESPSDPPQALDGVSVGSNGSEPSEALRRSYRVCCRCHCAGCGRHFASVEAFGLHRREWECHDPNDLVPRRRDTARTRLVPKDTDGICALAGYEVHGVTVWQVEADRDKGRRFDD
jgi:hypothetical protein